MPKLRWQLRLRTILILVAVAALLTSGGLWATRMRERYLTNRQRSPIYTAKANMIQMLAKAYAHDIMMKLGTVYDQSPDDAVSEIKRLNSEHVRLMKLKAQYERAASHPWERVLSTDLNDLRFREDGLRSDLPLPRLPSEPETRTTMHVCEAIKILPELDPGVLASLTTLWLDDSDVSDEAIQNLRLLPNLEDLGLSNTRISNSSLERLRPLIKLRTLILRGTSIGDAGLPHLQQLPHLESLNLAYTKVTNQGLLSLQRLPHLKEIRLLGTEVSDEGMRYLETLPELAIVDLRETKITDAALRSLGRLKKLELVELNDTSVTPAAIEALLKQRPGLHVEPGVEVLPPGVASSADLPPLPPGAMLPAELPLLPPGLRP